MASSTFDEAHVPPRPTEASPPRRRRLVLWFAIVAILLGLVGGGLYGFERFRRQAIAEFFASQVAPPTPVAAEPARVGPMPRYLNGIGSLTAVRQVDISPEVAGRVEAIAFAAGASVESGASLVQLNDAPEQADLASYRAAEKLALANLDRTRQLVRRDFATQAKMDENQEALEAARAGIARSQAVIEQKSIRAPFAGRLGLRQVELGQFVSPGDKLVTLTDLAHLYATFTLSERDRSSVSVGQPVELRADAYPDEVFKGEVTAIEPQVDPGTRVMRVQATLANPEHRLLPGMFVNARVVLPPLAEVVSVPETAVDHTLYGNSVFVVTEDGKDAEGKPVHKAVQTFVVTGPLFEGRIAITRGVASGDMVVSSGQLKLQNGAPVVVAADAPPLPAQTPVE